MTEADRDVRPGPASRFSMGAIVRASLPSLLISLGAGAWCWRAAGPGLGLFLGAMLLATLYTPALIVAEQGRARWLVLAASVCGAALVWLISINFIDVTITEWLRCVLVLAAYVLAIGGLASLLQRCRLPAPLAAGLVLLAGLLWLTWPVWMSPWLTQRAVNWLAPAHPIFAINSVVKHLGSWDHAPIAYRTLTNLNQDVPYQMPRSIFPSVIVHALIGAAAMAMSLRKLRMSHAGPAIIV